ncbi:MAG: TolC family protein [Gemmataceae bacterium]|nr:TolC family protein [Gemmataceae bacterium]
MGRRCWGRIAAGLSLLGTGCWTMQVTIPAAQPAPPAQVAHAAPTYAPAAVGEVSVSLDAVFRLAEAHNPRIGQAREKLNETLLARQAECDRWLPNTYVGLAYYRHEGGIQQENGTLLHSSTGALVPGLNIQSEWDLRESTFRALDAQRRQYQDQGELARIDNEVLLDAATTYLDLLTARRAEAVAQELERQERRLLPRSEKRAEKEPAYRPELENVQATLAGRQALIAKLRQQGNAAMLKLAYLLGLPPGTTLVPMDRVVVPLDLVDVSPPTEALVARAMDTGPGVADLNGILNVIQTGLDKSYGLHNLLPTVQLNIFEGAFGAGPGGQLAFDNRFDVAVNLRWNVAELGQTEAKRRQARSRQAQTMYALNELRGKLALGVQEGKDAVLHGREQIGLNAEEVRRRSEGYRLSDQRLEKGAQGASTTEVLMSLRGLEQAHFNYLQAIAAHNKAQVRLLMLVGSPKALPATAPVPEAPPAMLPVPKTGK